MPNEPILPTPYSLNAAHLLGLTPARLRKLARAAAVGTHRKPGGHYRFYLDQLAAFAGLVATPANPQLKEAS
jgi:hypothetical protein